MEMDTHNDSLRLQREAFKHKDPEEKASLTAQRAQQARKMQEKRYRGNSNRLLQLCHVERKAANSCVIVRDCAPCLRIVAQQGCEVCDAIREFFDDHQKGRDPSRPLQDNQESCCNAIGAADVRFVPASRSNGEEHHAVFYTPAGRGAEEVRLPLKFPAGEKARKNGDKAAKGPEAKSSIATTTVHRLKAFFELPLQKTLLPHQRKLVERVIREKPDVVLLYWSMGSGKTIGGLYGTAVDAPDECFVVCSNTMIDYWVDNIRQTPQVYRIAGVHSTEAAAKSSEDCPSTMTRFRVLGYTEFGRLVDENPNLVRGKMVVVDEPQRYRNVTAPMIPEIEAITKARRRFLLTGTPLVNDAEDRDGLGLLFGLKRSVSQHLTPEALKSHAMGRVSFYDMQVHDPKRYAQHYPRSEERVIRIPMTWRQVYEYILGGSTLVHFGELAIQQSRSNSYDSRTRAISNCLDPAHPEDSPKFQWLVNDILNRTGDGQGPFSAYPVAVYSHLRGCGVEAIEDMVKEDPRGKGNRVAVMTGSTPADRRQDIVKAYCSNKHEILLFTDVAGVGVDLKNTVDLYMMEPMQNLQSEGQIKTRVKRYDSHALSQQKDPCVRITKLLSVFPDPKSLARDQELPTLRKISEELSKLSRTAISVDFVRRELQAFVVKTKKSVDELTEERNVKKHEEIQPYLAALQECDPDQAFAAVPKASRANPRSSASTSDGKVIRNPKLGHDIPSKGDTLLAPQPRAKVAVPKSTVPKPDAPMAKPKGVIAKPEAPALSSRKTAQHAPCLAAVPSRKRKSPMPSRKGAESVGMAPNALAPSVPSKPNPRSPRSSSAKGPLPRRRKT